MKMIFFYFVLIKWFSCDILILSKKALYKIIEIIVSNESGEGSDIIFKRKESA